MSNSWLSNAKRNWKILDIAVEELTRTWLIVNKAANGFPLFFFKKKKKYCMVLDILYMSSQMWWQQQYDDQKQYTCNTKKTSVHFLYWF